MVRLAACSRLRGGTSVTNLERARIIRLVYDDMVAEGKTTWHSLGLVTAREHLGEALDYLSPEGE